MFSPFRKEDPQLEAAIEQVYKEMKTEDTNTEAYSEMVARLTQLNALKNQGLDPNQVLVAVANIFVTVAVIKHEQTAVIATKALSFFVKK